MSRLLLRPVVVALFVYLIALGATFNGIISPEIAQMTLIMTALIVACWLFIRWRRGWIWHRSPLDIVFLLWAAAFVISLLANMDAARRIAIGLWYVGMYIGMWYMLSDALANRGLSRDVLVDALLISGFIVVAIGYWQLQSWLGQVFTMGLSAPPRPVSIFGNPNFLSGFLIVLIPLLFSRTLLARGRLQRIALGVYTALAVLLLLLTFSRAAWLGMAFGGAIWLALVLAQKGLLSRDGFMTWWQQQTRTIRTALLTAATLFLLIGVVVVFIFIRSFSQTGRTADLRGDIYMAAVELFREKPITGQGLFTFGRGLVRLPDVQPDKPHSHAHNAVLHIAAELGIVGLAALAVTLFVMTKQMRLNWRTMQGREQLMLAGAIGAVVAFAVDQLGDIPAMMPAIAMTGLVALILAMTPTKAEPFSAKWTRLGFPIGVAALWGMLLLTGLWSNGVYNSYVSALSYAVESNDYRGGANRLQSVIEADPNLSLYSMEQAFLLGMEASTGDLDAARESLAIYQRFIALDPGYALAWANIASLHWQLGEKDQAIQAIREAARLDSNVWQYHLNLARYAEDMGDTSTTITAYDEVLKLYPDASLYPDLNQLAVRRQLSSVIIELSIPAQVVLLVESNQVEEAVQLWAQNPQPEAVMTDVIEVLLALAQGNPESALTWMAKAEALSSSPADEAWIHMGRSRIARLVGEDALAKSEFAEAQMALVHEPLDGDDAISTNIAYAQFLRFVIPRLFLPQVDYRVDDPVLLHLIAADS